MHYLRHLARLGDTDIHPGGAQATTTLAEALKLRDGLRLLELGCGTGGTIIRLVSMADVHVVGLDFLSEMLSVAQHRVSGPAAQRRCTLVRGSASMLPFVARSFDRVYAESVLGMQSERDARAALAEAFRVLKPGGLFVACEAIWKPHVDQACVTEVNRGCELHFGLRQASERAWSVNHWLEEIRKTGFQPLEWSSVPLISSESARGKLVSLWTRRLRLLSSPTLLSNHRLYRQRLANHQGDRELIEARLFVSARST